MSTKAGEFHPIATALDVLLTQVYFEVGSLAEKSG
jgi:hypothetical protein